MLLASSGSVPTTSPSPAVLRRSGARQLHAALLGEHGPSPGTVDELSLSAARSFLSARLATAAEAAADPNDTAAGGFPDDLRALPAWLEQGHRQTALAFRQYLDERQAGAPRRFFQTRSHALHFIRAVAPTKLVDGAWLYGVLPHWQDPRLAPLVRIYLEELGDGVAARNHVVLYRQLLARHGCERWQDLPEGHFTQGAVQLALAHHAADFLPEIIGFNLGYEQLPLHLPITAYELNELDVDPTYFTLHVTIDNASSGHARKALQCVLDCIPRIGDKAEFQRRVANGYRLNDVGMGTNDAIAGFDLQRELLAVLADKAAVGALLHADYCRVGGRSVSDWLATPGQLPSFLEALQAAGWIKRGQAPEHSRFWRLLHDAKAPMFGVFDAYELQLLRDWIAGDAAAPPTPARAVNRFRQRPGGDDEPALTLPTPAGATVRALIAHHLHAAFAPAAAGADEDTRWLAARLAGVDDKPQALRLLQGLLSPANHATPVGLLATRLFSALLEH